MVLLAARANAGISIHAPHEGERLLDFAVIARAQNISIHAPHEGERLECEVIKLRYVEFQSTLPTRGSDHKKGGNEE